MKQTLDLKTKNYFEGVIYYLGWGFLLITLVSIWFNLAMSVIFGLTGIMIVTARYKITIDPEQRRINDFLLILGMKTQEEKFRYSSLEYIYINKKRFTQRLNYKAIFSTISGTLYTAYLKTDRSNIYLGESTSLNILKSNINSLARQFDLEIKDP